MLSVMVLELSKMVCVYPVRLTTARNVHRMMFVQYVMKITILSRVPALSAVILVPRVTLMALAKPVKLHSVR